MTMEIQCILIAKMRFVYFKITKYVKYTCINFMIIAKKYSNNLVYEGLQHVNLSNISRIEQLTAFLNRLSKIE